MLRTKQAARTAVAVLGFFGRLEAEDLAQVAQVAGIFADGLARRVRHLGHRLAVALGHLEHDVDRLVAKVVGEVGADAERGARATLEAPRDLDRERHGKLVGEDERLGPRVDPVPAVVLDHLLAPIERVARIVARAVEELAEEHVEIPEERFQAVGIRDRDAEVAAIFLRPLVEGESLRVAQPRPERLARLHVLVRHGAERREIVPHREPDVGSAGEVLRNLALQRLHHFLVPRQRKAPARAEVRDLEVELGLDGAHERDLRFQTAPALVEVRPRPRAPEMELRDDGEHRDLVKDGVQPRPADRDVDLARLLAQPRGHVLVVELEQAEEVDEVGLHEAKRAQVFELFVAKAQVPELGELAVDAVEIGAQIRAFRAALELVLDLRTGEMVQHHLHHGEFVEVGVEQRLDDHAARIVTGAVILTIMCGRYALHANPDVVALQFGLQSVPEFKSSFNIAPAADILVIRERKALRARWGLRGKFVNLRAETVAARFRSSGRCLVPASGFYEWKTEGRRKQPFYFRPATEPLLAFAALWERDTCSLITTEPDRVVAKVHDRMP